MSETCHRCRAYQTWLREPDDIFGHRAAGRDAERVFSDLMERFQIRSRPGSCSCARSAVVRARRRGYEIGPGFNPKGRIGTD